MKSSNEISVLTSVDEELPLTIKLNIDNPTEEELKQVKLRIVEIDEEGEERVCEDFTIDESLTVKRKIGEDNDKGGKSDNSAADGSDNQSDRDKGDGERRDNRDSKDNRNNRDKPLKRKIKEVRSLAYIEGKESEGVKAVTWVRGLEKGEYAYIMGTRIAYVANRQPDNIQAPNTDNPKIETQNV
jgi:hypothetical protein